ncbi:hypothetical protein LZ30DRAFT_694965 [Colletotrichum cereale]|nr:hypothetical protein LZ30DRAFT_694965 [Colletotrichum cereale]
MRITAAGVLTSSLICSQYGGFVVGKTATRITETTPRYRIGAASQAFLGASLALPLLELSRVRRHRTFGDADERVAPRWIWGARWLFSFLFPSLIVFVVVIAVVGVVIAVAAFPLPTAPSTHVTTIWTRSAAVMAAGFANPPKGGHQTGQPDGGTIRPTTTTCLEASPHIPSKQAAA